MPSKNVQEQDDHYICIGPNVWGRGSSVEEAQEMACDIHGDSDRLSHMVVYDATESEGVEISGLDGQLSWLSASTPPMIVWMGSVFAEKNPGLEVGQYDGRPKNGAVRHHE